MKFQAGKAQVNLRLLLDPNSHVHHPQQEGHRRKPGPSRLRRHARRARARKEAAGVAADTLRDEPFLL